MKRAKILCTVLTAVLVLSVCGCRTDESDKLSIVTTVFPAYDFARAVAGEYADIQMLIEPGTHTHSYEPSPADIISIENADLFIYTGGESDAWVERVLGAVNTDRLKTVKMVDCAPREHEHSEGHHHEDEHVWTSPENAINILNSIAAEVCSIDSERKEQYLAAAESYCRRITELTEQTKAVIETAAHRKIVVADRFPLKHFCEYYNLEYEAAFDACDTFADADAATVIRLCDAVRAEGLSYVFCIENSSGATARTVCEETGAGLLVLHSLHTVTLREFEDGITYIDVMSLNKSALERGIS